MALEDLTKSLSDFTSDVTDKVTDTVKNPLKAMKDSVEGVTKTVLGPRLDIVQQAQDELSIEQLKTLYKKTVRSWAAAVRKQSVSAPKVTAMVKALNSFSFHGDDFDTVYTNIKGFLALVRAEIKKGQYVGALEDNAIKSLKKFSLTKTEQPHFEETIKDAVDGYNHDAPEVKNNLAALITVPAKKKNDINAVYKAETKKLDTVHGDSMDASIELLRGWRSFFSVLRSAEKNMKLVKKLEEKKRTGTPEEKKKVADEIAAKLKTTKELLEKEGKKAVDAITAAEKKIESGYKGIDDILKGYTASYADAKTGLTQWITDNSKQTISVAKTNATDSKKNQSAYKSLIAKEKTIMSTIYATLKKPFTGSEKVIKEMQSFDANYNAQQTALLSLAVTTASDSLHAKKDQALKSVLLNTFHTYIYNDMLLLRKNTVFLGFANRYHRSHATYAKDAWDKLIDLKRTDATMVKSFVSLMQKKAEYYNGLIKTNDKMINDQKSQVSAFRSMQREVVKVQRLLNKEADLLETKAKMDIHTTHYESLKNEVKRLVQHNKMMKKYNNEIEGAMKKTLTELKDKEKSLTVKSTPALKKEIELLHKQKHEQEAVHNSYTHYIEELQGHIQELKDLDLGYGKVGKQEKKLAASQEKSLKQMQKKTEKMKTMQEINV